MVHFLRVAIWRLLSPAITFLVATSLVAFSDTPKQSLIFQAFALQVLANSLEYPYFIAAKKNLQVPPIFLLCAVGLICLLSYIMTYSKFALAYCIVHFLVLVRFSSLFYVEQTKGVLHTTLWGICRAIVINLIFVAQIFQQYTFIYFVGALLLVLQFSSNIQKDLNKLSVFEMFGYVIASVALAYLFIADRQLILELTSATVANTMIVLVSIIMTISNIFAVSFILKTQSRNKQTYVFSIIGALLVSIVSELVWGEKIAAALAFLVVPVVYTLNSPWLLRAQLTNIAYVAIPLAIVSLIKMPELGLSNKLEISHQYWVLLSLAPLIITRYFLKNERT